MSTETQGNVATIRRFYDLVLGGDLDAASALLADDLVIHEPKELPYGGEFHGVAGWREVTEHEFSLLDAELLAPIEFWDAEGSVVMLVQVRFTSRATGQSAETTVLEQLEVRDGQITVFDVFYKDPAAVAALVP